MGANTSHLDQVRDDVAYSDILANWDAAFYAKFTRTLRPPAPGARTEGAPGHKLGQRLMEGHMAASFNSPARDRHYEKTYET